MGKRSSSKKSEKKGDGKFEFGKVQMNKAKGSKIGKISDDTLNTIGDSK